MSTNLSIRNISDAVVTKIDALANGSRESFLRDLLCLIATEGAIVTLKKDTIETLEKRTRTYPGMEFAQIMLILSEAVNSSLQVHYNLMQHALSTIELSESEAMLLCDVFNGVWLRDLHSFSPGSYISILLAEVGDAIELEHVDDKWSVDGKAFLEKLKTLTPLQAIAVLDAVQQFWTDKGYQIGNAFEKVRIVGLVRSEPNTIQVTLPELTHSNLAKTLKELGFQSTADRVWECPMGNDDVLAKLGESLAKFKQAGVEVKTVWRQS